MPRPGIYRAFIISHGFTALTKSMRDGNPGKIAASLVPWSIFILGAWFAVIRVFGPGFTFVPGDLVDARFNNFVLEHFSRWISGLEPSYWSAQFFYPYPNSIAFGDNLLGSAFLYALFRRLSLDRETAFQAWYFLGFFLNYAAAVYALRKLTFRPLAVAAGAFFFTFGLPMMAQETHAQLVYRCAVPLACYFLWEFSARPQLWKLSLVGLSLVWQIYLSVYLGVFLAMLLLAIAVLLPLRFPSRTWRGWLLFWPRLTRSAWRDSGAIRRLYFLALCIGLGLGLLALFLPYYSTSEVYGFTRSWAAIQSMLPRARSLLLADGSLIWGGLSERLVGVPMRWEHQMFPGLTVTILVVIGLIWRPKSENAGIVWAHFWAAIILLGITFWFRGYSAYQFLWSLPGLNSIRAVSRIVLVLMWPGAVFIAFVIDSLVRNPLQNGSHLLRYGVTLSLLGALFVETLAFRHVSYNKAESTNRLAEIRSMIPVNLPPNPILIVSSEGDRHWSIRDVDAMLVAQDLGWPVLNGYSGNSPVVYHGSTNSCRALPDRIMAYMDFAQISDQHFYLDMMKRVVPVGFKDCDPLWWERMP